MIREFQLSPRGKRGVSCDTEGAFIGAVPLLDRLQRNGKNVWQPRDCKELSEEIGKQYGLPVDISSKRGGLKAIANALNEGDVTRAQIATVLLGAPELPPLAKGVRSREQTIKLIRDLDWSGLLKWDPDEHPRWPAGSSGGKGGEFAPKGEGGATAGSPTSPSDTAERAHSYNREPDGAHRSARVQLADNSESDAFDEPVAEAVHAAAAAQRNTGTTRSRVKPVDSEHQNFWQTLGSRLSHKAKVVLSQLAYGVIAENNANRDMDIAGVRAAVHTMRTYVEYRAQPWIEDGRRVQVSTIETGDPLSDRAARMGHLLLEPNAPLTRPATNADWLDPLMGLVTMGAMSVDPALGLAGPAEVFDSADFAAFSVDATGYRATFGKALTNDYRATFFESNPGLQSRVVVHHAVPQRTLALYPDEVTESEIHSLENLRGIPNELNSDVHLSQIAREWNQFYKTNPNATQEQLLQKATEIDLKYGRRFKPPVGRDK